MIWEEEEKSMEEKGILYVMSTAVDGLLKIGKTRSDQFEIRMSDLERNGYRNVTKLERKFAIEVEDFDSKEVLLHTIFSKSRIGQTELFAADLETIIQLLSSFEGKQVYPKNRTKEEVFEEAKDKQDEENSALLPDGLYRLTKNVKGFGKVTASLETKNGKMVVKAGSICAPSSNPKYQTIQNKANIQNAKLQEDYPCTSVSTAAVLVSGHSENGWTAWKDQKGNPIDIYRNK